MPSFDDPYSQSNNCARIVLAQQLLFELSSKISDRFFELQCRVMDTKSSIV